MATLAAVTASPMVWVAFFRQLTIALDDVIQMPAAADPFWRQLFVQSLPRPFVVLALVQVQDLCHSLVERQVIGLELVERGLVGGVLDQFF
nr:hypothetical protein GCM10020185_17410 [Pseudomonas brassicacearum subsp. brassicacearum]